MLPAGLILKQWVRGIVCERFKKLYYLFYVDNFKCRGFVIVPLSWLLRLPEQRTSSVSAVINKHLPEHKNLYKRAPEFPFSGLEGFQIESKIHNKKKNRNKILLSNL